ncbi:hypothetical protein [Arthrobacter sp. 135MFCol5.1]|uniref:hypothetical protein n=1 Tax=Arthrobacter sp. 135MFCol5.1 TaxID=1158050 RepID=UPI00037A89F8|nr:hypothetical protein [Arthrobacter sp. 135MFCol5.1]
MENQEPARVIDPDDLKYRVTSVLLDDMSVETSDFEIPKTKRVRFQFSGATADEFPLLRLTKTVVELLDSDGDSAVTLKCTYKINFAISEDEQVAELDDELRIAAMRVSYPYHRQLISDMTSRLGLRPTFLPAVPDELWADEEAEVS